jgi:hypothetical protein
MKILLRNKRTGLYYSLNGQWTSDPHRAHDFKTSLSAVRHVVATQLDAVEFIYSFSDPRENFVLPAPNPIQMRCE